MRHRNFFASTANSILLYGFGLALLLSLVFNGFLLYNQSRQTRLSDYEVGSEVLALHSKVWQLELSECQRDNQRKDSLIHHLTGYPDPPSEKPEVHQRQANLPNASH